MPAHAGEIEVLDSRRFDRRGLAKPVDKRDVDAALLEEGLSFAKKASPVVSK
jgi:hypothetical protein